MVDLCAAPGGWSQVASQAGCACVAVDIKEIAPLPGVVRVAGDITAADTCAAVVEAMGGHLADMVLCDGAPDVYGIGDIDCHLQNRLVEAAVEFSRKVLCPGGCLVSKIYRSRVSVFSDLQNHFESVVCAKPRSSRNASREAFVVARGFGNGKRQRSIPFLPCGFGQHDFDSDSSYPLQSGDATVKDPVQMPLNPAHLAANRPKTHIPDDVAQDGPAAEVAKASDNGRSEKWASIGHVQPSFEDHAPVVRPSSDLPLPATGAESLLSWCQLNRTTTIS